MMKVILDTNVFMSGIFWSGPPAKILDAWHKKKFNLVLSKDILDEYIRVSKILSQKYSKINVDEIIELAIKHSQIYDIPPLPYPISRDKDDDKFIACAIAAEIKIIVSGDIDLLEVSGFNGLEIMKPRQFLDLYLV